MDMWGADKLTLFVIFVLPGFISMKIYDLLVPGEPREASRSLVEAIGYSTLNFAALFWLIAIILSGDFFHKHPVLYALSVFLIMVVAPVLWPIVFLRLACWRPVARHIVHPFRKPWDYVFGKREPFWVILHLQNGQRIGGRYGTESFASSYPADEQIYLEEVWILDDAGRFVAPVERSRGVIIAENEIRAVEFFQ